MTGRVFLAVQAAKRVAELEDPSQYDGFEPPDRESAAAAVEELGRQFEAMPRFARGALRRAGQGAEMLSSDHLQGLSEVIQNADDVGATVVRMSVANDALWFAHDGRPLRLPNVLALATPWQSTKASSSTDIGRFGIGLMTLRVLSSTLEMDSGNYCVRFGEDSVAVIDPLLTPVGLASAGWTVMRVPLERENVSLDDLTSWLATWGDGGMLFLQALQRIDIVDDEGALVGSHSLTWTPAEQSTAFLQQVRLALGSSTTWRVYAGSVPTPVGVERAYKASGDSIPVGVAFCVEGTDEGTLHAGLPLSRLSLPFRLNSQFDPLASRQGAASTPWNEACLDVLIKFWAEATVDFFAVDPRACWSCLPIGTESGSVESQFISQAVAVFPRSLILRSESGTARAVGDLAYATPALDGLLREDEIARLAEAAGAFPVSALDANGAWRRVLESWRTRGAELSREIEVADALPLLSQSDFAPDRAVRLLATALGEGLGNLLQSSRCLVTSDNRRIVPPSSATMDGILIAEAPILSELGFGVRLDPAYAEDHESWDVVVEWLREIGGVLDSPDPSVVLARMASVGRSGALLSPAPDDRLLLGIRDLAEQIPAVDRAPLLGDIGNALLLDGFEYTADGKRLERPVPPSGAYLSARIEREPDSFALAAATTPGLTWVHARYNRLLRSGQGRTGLGAQRFLHLLGVENAPRIVPHRRTEFRFAGAKHGVPAAAHESPSTRQAALREIDATFTLDDYEAPHLIAVARDIAGDQSARRVRRSEALLSSLGRAWQRLEPVATARGAEDHYQWNSKGDVAAFWVYQCADIAWLPDSKRRLRRPHELRFRTPGSIAMYGSEYEDFLLESLASASRRLVLDALGVRGEPSVRELVDRLVELRQAQEPADLPGAAAAYLALANRMDNDRLPRGEITIHQLRAEFNRAPGLVLSNRGWRRALDVFSGPPIFGRRRAFVPQMAGTERLWRALQIQVPSVSDGLEFLKEFARQRTPPSEEDLTTLLETFRLIEKGLASGVHVNLGRKGDLRDLRLWTTLGWKTDRPIYYSTNPLLALELGDQMAIWLPGGEVQQFPELLKVLRLSQLTAAGVTATAEPSPGERDLADLYCESVALLKEDLARNDPLLAASLTIGWDELAEIEPRVDPDFSVQVLSDSFAGNLVAAPAAWVDLPAKRLFLRNGDALRQVEAAGRAVADLFRSDGRRVAHAWGAAVERADRGIAAARIVLSSEIETKEREAIRERLNELTTVLTTRTERAATPGAISPSSDQSPPTPTLTPAPPLQLPPARVLVNPNDIDLADSSGIVSGTSTTGTKRGRGKGGGLKEPTFGRPWRTRPPREIPRYDPQSREDLGLTLLRRVLRRNDQELTDLRDQHGVGADAVDGLLGYFEMKVYAGTEPEQVSLTPAELERAMSGEPFYLAVISGVEGRDATPVVRLILNPATQLTLTPSSSVTLRGIRDSVSLTFPFAQRVMRAVAEGQ